MSLMKKLRAPALAVMLSAAAMGTIGGCTTISPWKETGRELISSSLPDKQIKKEAGKKTEAGRVFEISDLNVKDNSYLTQISDSLFEKNYQIKDVNRIKQYEEIINEEREVKEFGPGMFFGPAILAMVGAAVGEYFLGGKSGEGDMELSSEAIIGGIVGFGVGLYADKLVAKNKKGKIETRQKKTGRVEEGSPIYERREIGFSDEGWVYRNQASSGTSVKLSFAGLEKYVLTNGNGEINLSEQLGEGFFFPEQSATRQQLEIIVRQMPLVSQIKDATLKVLLKELINEVDRYDSPLVVATEQESLRKEVVENASRTFMVGTYNLGDADVLRIVNKFVDKEINPSIKNLNFLVRNKYNHIFIDGSNFEFTTDSPSKSQLAGKYFTGDLKEFAEKCISDYLYGKSTKSNCSGKPSFSVYYPSSMFVEITHPEYNYVSGEVDIKKYLERPCPVEMVDLGKKVRVQGSKEELGTIGED